MKIIRAIKSTDSTVLLYGILGVIFIVLGGILLNMNPPNVQIGYPTTAIGFALFVFAITTENAIKSTKKSDIIIEKLEAIQKELKKKE